MTDDLTPAQWEAEERWHERMTSGVVRMSSVEPERVSWLWPGRIPRGKLTVLDGDPKLGKSTVMLDIAARVTTGRALPDGTPVDGPSGVVLLTAEDGLADTVRPRLDAADGDASRVVVLETVPTEHGPRLPSFPEDVQRLEELVRDEGATLVVVDVLNAYLSCGVNNYRDQDVRRALLPLARMAEATSAAVVALRHLTKSRAGRALYAGGGSIGIVGAARSVLLVAPDPDDDSRRVLAVTACNVAEPVPSLGFSLTADPRHDCGRIEWLGTVGHRADDLLNIDTAEERSALSEASAWLSDYLRSGPRPQREVKTHSERAGHHWTTIRRAKDRLRIRSRKIGAPGEVGEWRWSLPEDVHGRAEDAQSSTMSMFGELEHLRGRQPDPTRFTR